MDLRLHGAFCAISRLGTPVRTPSILPPAPSSRPCLSRSVFGHQTGLSRRTSTQTTIRDHARTDKSLEVQTGCVKIAARLRLSNASATRLFSWLCLGQFLCHRPHATQVPAVGQDTPPSPGMCGPVRCRLCPALSHKYQELSRLRGATFTHTHTHIGNPPLPIRLYHAQFEH